MARTHRQLSYGTLGPGATADYTVPADKKLVLSSVLMSSSTVAGSCAWTVALNPGGGGPKLLRGTVSATGPVVLEPWLVALPGDVLRVTNESSVGGPNLEYGLSGILYDLP